MKRTIFVFLTVVLAIGSPALWAVGSTEITLVQPPCGVTWLESGLQDSLMSKDYIADVNSIAAGTTMDPDPGRPASLGDIPGDRMAMNHWILWFNDYLKGIESYDCRGCVSRIIVFDSCFDSNGISSDGNNLGNPFSPDKNLTNYKSVFRHPSGPGNTYLFSGNKYRALDDVMAANPDILFVVVTAPPLHDKDTTATQARRARQFNDWLRNDWQTSYRNRYPRLNNVAVFDWYNLLANPADSPYQPNVLKAAFGGDALGTSTLNTAAHIASTNSFSGAPGNFIDSAWNLFSKEVLYFAQLGVGPGLGSELVLTNPSASHPLASTIEFLGNDGSALQVAVSVIPAGRVTDASPGKVSAEIPGGGGLIVRTNPTSELLNGSAVVSADGQLGGIIRFSIADRGIAGVGASLPLSGFTAPIRRQSNGINTGIALINTSGLPVNLELQLLDLQGLPVAGGTNTISGIPPAGHLAQFINELLPDADTSDFEGSLTVRVIGGKVAATVLELGTSSGQFTTLPVIPLDDTE